MITLTFLSLLGIMTTTEVRRYYDQSYGKVLYHSSKKIQEKVLLERAMAELEHFKAGDKECEDIIFDQPKPNPKKKSSLSRKRWRSLEFDEERPPNNSRLNLYLLLTDPKTDHPLSTYNIAARLLRALYGEEPFFNMAPQMENKILDELIIYHKDKVLTFLFPDELSELKIRNQDAQKAFYKVLKGSIDEEEDFPSLLYYVTLDNEKHQKINFMFASQLLLEVIFEERQIYEPLLNWRDGMLKQMRKQEKESYTFSEDDFWGRKEIKEELRVVMETALTGAGKDPNPYFALFDLSLGKKGNVLFITDEKSGRITRDKIRFPRR